MFNEMDPIEFARSFQNEDDCREYLYRLKWSGGFKCKRCGNNKCWKGRTRFHARCTACGYDESLTAHTIFQNLHIPLLKAFTIVYQVAVLKKGVSSLNLSKIMRVSQKSLWLFKRKIQEAMATDNPNDLLKYPHKSGRIADGVILTHRQKDQNGLQRAYLWIADTGDKKKKGRKMKSLILDRSQYDFCGCRLLNGRYVDEKKDILIWNFRNWLSGTHHHCAHKYLQGYLDEFSFRLNHSDEPSIWRRLMERIMTTKPYNHKHNAEKGYNRIGHTNRMAEALKN